MNRFNIRVCQVVNVVNLETVNNVKGRDVYKRQEYISPIPVIEGSTEEARFSIANIIPEIADGKVTISKEEQQWADDGLKHTFFVHKGDVYKRQPLYIVDGFQVDNIDYLANSDIESIQILKDASSSAIYGAREMCIRDRPIIGNLKCSG